MRLAFFSPIHLPVSKVSLHHSYGRYFDSDFSTNVEAAIVKLALSVAIIVASTKGGAFKTKVELPPISSYVYLIHSL